MAGCSYLVGVEVHVLHLFSMDSAGVEEEASLYPGEGGPLRSPFSLPAMVGVEPVSFCSIDCFFFFFSVKVFCCWAACFLPGEQAFTVVRFVVLCAPIGISGFSDSFSSESGIVEAKISPGNSLLYCFLGVFQLCLFLNNISGL